MFARKDDFAGDMSVIRRRWAEIGDAPPLSDAMGFPDRESLQAMLDFNRSYRCYLVQASGVTTWEWWETHEALNETDRLYHVIDLARDAAQTYYHTPVRRGALKRLRERIGYAAYCSGTLPPCVPLERFAKMR